MTSKQVVLTSDNVRKVVAQEGLEARNLLNWNVIVGGKASEASKNIKKPPTSPRPQSVSPRPPLPKDASENHLHTRKRCPSLSHPKSRVRSSSAGRNPEKGLRARYWAFLFENLYRAVDEIYQTCEMDESIVECKEAILMLENYCKEFQALIHWLTISKSYEVTPPPNRPTSLAWEVRKSLPSKGMLKNIFFDKIITQSGARRKLDLHVEPPILLSTAVQADIPDETQNSTECFKNSSSNATIESSFKSTEPVLLKPQSGTDHQISKESSGGKENRTGNSLVPVVVDSKQEPTVKDDDLCKNIPAESNRDMRVVDVIVTEHFSKASTETENPKCSNVSVENDNVTNILASENGCSEVKEICLKAGENGRKPFPISFGNVDSLATCDNGDDNCAAGCQVCSVKIHHDKATTFNCAVQNDLKSKKIRNDFQQTVSTNCEASDSLNIIYSSSESVKISEKECDDTTIDASKSDALSPVTCPITRAFDAVVKTSDNNKINPVIFPEEKKPLEDKLAADEVVEISTEPKISCSSTDVCDSSSENIVLYGKSSQSSQTEEKFVGSVVLENVEKTAATVPKTSTCLEKNEQQCNGFAAPVTKAITSTVASAKTYALKTSLSKPTPTHTTPINKSFRNEKFAKNTSETKGYALRAATERKTNQVSGANVTDKSRFRMVGVAGIRNSDRYVVLKPVKTAAGMTRSRPSQHHLGKELCTQAKMGSSLSLNLNCTSSENTDELRRQNSDLCRKPTNLENGDDSGGWETVRGRARCKNSPAKKVPFSAEAVAVKLNQTKMGGFPYTCTPSKYSTKASAKTPISASNKISEDCKVNREEQHSFKAKTVSKDTVCCDTRLTSKKITKEVSKSDDFKKNIPKKEEKASKSPKSKPVIQSKVNSKISLKSSGDSINSLSDSTSRSKTTVRKQKCLSNSNNITSVTPGSKSPLLKESPTANFNTKKSSIVHDKSPTEPLQVSNCVDKAKENEPSSLISLKAVDETPSDNDVDGALKKTIQEVPLPVSLKTADDDAHCEKPCSGLESDQYLQNLNSDLNYEKESLNDPETLEVYEQMMRKETQEHICQLGLSWGDQMDLVDMDLRTPGRALQIHEKLSSPFKKRTLAETIRLQEEKQLKAQEQRERFLEEKAQRFKDIQKKVEEMRAFTEKKAEQQRMILEQKLQRAEEKRKKELEKIIKKAHDEEEKVNEIAFINSLEAQNKRHDLISKEKDHEARLQDIQDERQRKLEEKAAKEAAAEERRKVLEAERQARLFEMQEKRKQKDLKIEQQLLEKEKERQELANQKARDRELRLSALNAAQQANAEELQKKIQLKQEESARRHEENIEQIRQKAFELTVRRYSSNNDDAPQLVPYEKKKICTICNVLIGSEVYLLSHLRGKKHQEMISDQHQGYDPSTEELELYNLKHIVDATVDQINPNISVDKERQKALKKRCKKLRQKMANKAQEFKKHFKEKLEANENCGTKFSKFLRELKKCQSLENAGLIDSGRTNSEKNLLLMAKEVDKLTLKDKVEICTIGGTGLLLDLILKMSPLLNCNTSVIPYNVLKHAYFVAEGLINNCFENCVYALMSNSIGIALDVLLTRLKMLIPDNFKQVVSNTNPSLSGKCLPVDDVASLLMRFLAVVLDFLSRKRVRDPALLESVNKFLPKNQEVEFSQRISEVISYIVSIGIIERLSQYFSNVRDTVKNLPDVATFLLHAISFLMSVIKLSSDSYNDVFERKKSEDINQLTATLKFTDLAGVVSLLYCILLHDGPPSFGDVKPSKLPEHTMLLALAGLRMLNHALLLNIYVIQGILGSEGISLQLRHITNYLLWYCSHHNSIDLLHETILLVGYFTVMNSDNQTFIQSGQQPTVLKQLCDLPFVYFSNPELTDILFPTFISCCFLNDHNKNFLWQEMSVALLCNYLEKYLLDWYAISQKKNDSNIRWRLQCRFPKCRWTSAKTYFLKPS